jgi:heterodisulfide reductase subunit C2
MDLAWKKKKFLRPRRRKHKRHGLDNDNEYGERNAMSAPMLYYQPESARPFAEEVAERSGQKLLTCYQCRRCAAGCPVSEQVGSWTPDRLIRLIVLGDRTGALANPLVWKCVSCYTCGTRCPNDIQTGRITETLKKMAAESGVAPVVPKIKHFHDRFMNSALRWGRVNELEFMGFYELDTTLDSVSAGAWREVIAEMAAQTKNFALPMLKTGRLHPELPSFHGRRELARLAKKSKK